MTVHVYKQDARPRCEAAGGRDSVQTNMAGPQVPDAGAHPTITFSLGDDRHADANRWTVTGTHSLRGRERTPRACALLACRVDESGLPSAITFASRAAFGKPSMCEALRAGTLSKQFLRAHHRQAVRHDWLTLIDT